jgi:serine/threonine protein kinase
MLEEEKKIWEKCQIALRNDSLDEIALKITKLNLKHKRILELNDISIGLCGVNLYFEQPYKSQMVADLYVLSKCKNGFTEPMIARVAFQLLDALKYLHKKKIVLRHLRPDRVLVKEGFQNNEKLELVISDVQFMYCLNDPSVQKSIKKYPVSGMNRLFLAPEIRKAVQSGQNSKIGSVEWENRVKEDVWSLGVILYFMIVGDTGKQGKLDFMEDEWSLHPHL